MKYLRNFLTVGCIFAVLISAVSLSASAFTFMDGNFGFELNTYLKEATLVEYTGNDTVVAVPSSYASYTLRNVNKSAFSGNTTAQIINLPTTVNRLEREALADCTSLQTFTVSANITSYGEGLLKNCSALESAYLLSGSTAIPSYTFQNCSNLSTLQLSATVNSIGNSAFWGCSALTDAPFLSQISTIDEFAFYGSGLESVTISDLTAAIPAYAFANCASLTRVNIPAGVSSIDSTAFVNDPNLTLGVYYGSFAYTYAKENNFSYVLLDGVKHGDANGDGNVNINDVTAIQRDLAELEKLNELQALAADINGDGIVDIADATALQQYLAEYEIPYPIGEVATL